MSMIDVFKNTEVNAALAASIFHYETHSSKFQIRQNYQYFLDVAEKAAESNDHNTAIMVRAALMHHAICQLKLKPRKKDKEG